jgi:hypothetical protein
MTWLGFRWGNLLQALLFRGVHPLLLPDLVDMTLRLDLRPHLFDDPLLIDRLGDPTDAFIFLTIA